MRPTIFTTSIRQILGAGEVMRPFPALPGRVLQQASSS